MKTIHHQTIHTNCNLQLCSIYRRRILFAAEAFPSRYYFATHVFGPESDLAPKYIEADGFDEVADNIGMCEVAILRHAYRTNENRLGIVSLIPDGATLIETEGAPTRCVHPSMTLPAKVQI